MKKESLSLYDGIIYRPEGEIKYILQVIHGISEHIGRYEELAYELCQHGIAVAGFDLKGHGMHKNDDGIATMNQGGWYQAIDQVHQFNLYLQGLYQIPTFIMGFSLGSFLLKEYASLYLNPSLRGIIIAGTGYQPKMLLNMMISVVQTQINSFGFDNNTALVDKLLFENYNHKFSNNKTPFDWLCSDENEIQKYINDELCVKKISTGLFYQLLCSMKTTGYRRIYDTYNKELPILLISGKEDVVGDFTKAIQRVYKDIVNEDFKDVEMYIIENSRHDMFHEHQSGASKKTANIIKDWILKH